MRRPIVLLLSVLLTVPALAQETAPASTGDDRPATQAELKALSEEVRRLKLEMSVPDAITFGSYAGMGPAASRVHLQPKGLSIGGYGEIVFTSNDDGAGAHAEVLRLVLYVGYRFSDLITFNSEVEFEHGAKEISIEMAYVDFAFLEPLKLRVGSLLVPVGFLNENHEPIFFHGVFRPHVDRYIIPTTWTQIGGGLYGDVGALRYKAFAIAGMDVFGGEGPLEAGSWIRNARTGSFGPARTWAGVGNLNVDVGPATFGGSFYFGNAGQGYRTPTGDVVSPWVTLGEVHALVAWRGLQARALLAFGSLSQAGQVSEILNKVPEEYIGSRAWGGYVEASYDVLTLVNSSMSLSPFFRFEALNPQAAVEGAGVLNPALDQRVFTVGLDFKPIPQVVVKADWQGITSGVPGLYSQWDLGVGFVY